MKTKKSTPSAMMFKDFNFHLEQDKKFLLARYKNTQGIINQLREIPTHARTYEFLSELFFNACMRELEKDPPTEEWMKQMKDVRGCVFELFELARAAKVMV
jgi:hypothetical protein